MFKEREMVQQYPIPWREILRDPKVLLVLACVVLVFVLLVVVPQLRGIGIFLTWVIGVTLVVGGSLYLLTKPKE